MPSPLQPLDLLSRQAEPAAIDLVVVLPHVRPEPFQLAGRLGKLGQHVGDDHPALARIEDLDQVLARGELGILEDVGDGVDRARRHLVLLAMFQQRVAVHAADEGRDDPVHPVALGQALRHGRVLVGGQKVEAVHRLAQALPHAVVGAGERDPFVVPRPVVAVRHDVDGVGAHALAHIARLGVGRRHLVEHAEHAFVEADVDILSAAVALPPDIGDESTERAVEAADVIGKRGRSGDHRRAIRLAGQVGKAREAVGDAREARPVVVGAGLAVGRDAHQDDLGIDLLHVLVAQAPAFEGSGREILDDDVGLGDQALGDLEARGLAQVERDAALVARLAQPVERGAGRRHRPEVCASCRPCRAARP